MADAPPAGRSSGEVEVHEIRVALLGDAPGRPMRGQTRAVRRRARVIVALALLAAVGIAFSRMQPQRAHVTAKAATTVSAAYGYPSRCLAVTIAREFPNYARADLDHRPECGTYTGYSTAIFHRANGVWRVVLDASTYSCPLASIPARVQAALGVCWWSPRHRSSRGRKSPAVRGQEGRARSGHR